MSTFESLLTGTIYDRIKNIDRIIDWGEPRTRNLIHTSKKNFKSGKKTEVEFLGGKYWNGGMDNANPENNYNPCADKYEYAVEYPANRSANGTWSNSYTCDHITGMSGWDYVGHFEDRPCDMQWVKSTKCGGYGTSYCYEGDFIGPGGTAYCEYTEKVEDYVEGEVTYPFDFRTVYWQLKQKIISASDEGNAWASMAAQLQEYSNLYNDFLDTLLHTTETLNTLATYFRMLIPKRAVRDHWLRLPKGERKLHPLDYFFCLEPTAGLASDMFTAMNDLYHKGQFNSKVPVRCMSQATAERDLDIPWHIAYWPWWHARRIERHQKQYFRLTYKGEFSIPGTIADNSFYDDLARSTSRPSEMWRAIPNSWWLDGFLRVNQKLDTLSLDQAGMPLSTGALTGVLNEVLFTKSTEKIYGDMGTQCMNGERINLEYTWNGLKRDVRKDITGKYLFGKMIYHQNLLSIPPELTTLFKGSTYWKGIQIREIK